MKIRFIVSILAAILCFSCDQYPIFYAVYQEVKPTEPRIKGNPTAVIELSGTAYVASRFGRTIYSYQAGNWTTSPSPPGGGIMEIASDGISLYALTGIPLKNTEVYVYKDSQWKLVSLTGGGIIQTIRGAGNASAGYYIFASTKSELFFYKKDDAAFSPLLSDLSEENIVTGAALADNTFYVAVVNRGIYTFDGTALSDEPVTGTAGKAIVGMIAVEDTIVAVSRDGELFYGDSSQGFDSDNNSVTFSGAIGTWRDPADATKKLLLVGIQADKYSTVNGYREILLPASGPLPTNNSLRMPGANNPTTVSNTDRYTSTVGLRIVTSLYQAPDGILFAPTMKHGLWSYRRHGEREEVWNAEE